MPGQLSRFRVTGLHGRRDMDVHIEANRLILVGENGAGKSTFANLIYYFLTRQWNRFRDYRFQEILAVVDGIEFKVTPEKVEAFSAHQHQTTVMFRQLAPHARFKLKQTLENVEFPETLDDDEFIFTLSDELHLPPRRAMELVRQWQIQSNENPPELQSIGKTIASLMSDQFLYLPTYLPIDVLNRT